mmetsp:Transcript_9301/g.20695  ORF Transcript_9301/g.20695 Transcript_9301/m.20695 type:complete len:475 (-) Transcript_9301:88-1512(-)
MAIVIKAFIVLVFGEVLALANLEPGVPQARSASSHPKAHLKAEHHGHRQQKGNGRQLKRKQSWLASQPAEVRYLRQSLEVEQEPDAGTPSNLTTGAAPPQMLNNNLGGAGPDVTLEKGMVFGSVAPDVDLVVSNITVYEADTSHNGIQGGFGTIGVAAGTSVDLKFSLVSRTTGQLVKKDNFTFSAVHLDCALDGTGQLQLIASGYKKFYVSADTMVKFERMTDGRVAFLSSARSDLQSMVPGLLEVDDTVMASSVALEYHDVSEFEVTLVARSGPTPTRFFHFVTSSAVPAEISAHNSGLRQPCMALFVILIVLLLLYLVLWFLHRKVGTNEQFIFFPNQGRSGSDYDRSLDSPFRTGLFSCHAPCECLVALCCPCVMTYQLFWEAAPFSVKPCGLIVTTGTALLWAIVIWVVGTWTSVGLVTSGLIALAVMGIETKYSIHEPLYKTLLKAFCCLCCYQLQVYNEVRDRKLLP